MTLNDDNIELYLFRYKEGLLNADETAEVERALAERPDWKELADLYDPELKLPAGITMPYSDADTLRDGGPKAGNTPVRISLRDEEPRRRRLMPLWTSVAAAACILLFVTTIAKFVNNFDGGVGSNYIAGTIGNENIPQGAVQNDTDFVQPVQYLPQHNIQVEHPVINDEPVFLAESVEEEVQPTDAEEMAVDTNRTKYDLDEPTLREVNDPMDQEVLYANIINWQSNDSEPFETPSRRQPLRNIARKATTIIATAASGYEENRENIEGAIEERIQSNPIVNNLIATIE